MTRVEAQTLAEELVLRMARDSFRRRRMGWDAVATTFCGGIRALFDVIEARGQVKSNAMVMIAACAIEVLRETFANCGETAEQIREQHPLGTGGSVN